MIFERESRHPYILKNQKIISESNALNGVFSSSGDVTSLVA